MKPSKTWVIVVAVIVVLVGIRMSIGQGMARAYVERVDQSVEVKANDTHGASTEKWTEWHPVAPKKFEAAQKADPSQTKFAFSWANTIGLWLAAFFTLAIFSFLYRDNPGYRLAEAVIIGVSAAYWGVIGFWDTLVPKLFGALTPNLIHDQVLPSLPAPTNGQVVAMYFALALGLMLLMRLAPKGGWISLWPIAFIIGVTAGLKIVSHVESDLVAQSIATFKPLVQPIVSSESAQSGWMLWPTIWASLANILLVVGVLCCLTYFFFSIEHKGVAGRAARVGIMYLMITFGAAFGFTVMGRVALLAARIEFLFDDWLWLIDPAGKRIVEVASAIGSMLCWW